MAVVIAFGGAFTYPVWFRFVKDAPLADRVMFHRAQAFIGQWVISPGLLVIILAGAYLATDRDLWDEPWVTTPLVIAIALGAMGGRSSGRRRTSSSSSRRAATRPGTSASSRRCAT